MIPRRASCPRGAAAGATAAAAVAILVLAGAGPAAAADLPAPPARHFDDRVGLVDGGDAARLADALAGFEQRTGIQFVVTVLPGLDGDVETYVSRLYEAWGVGGKSTNRGVLLAVFPAERRSRIEVGYGLEDSLPDVLASRILRRMTEMPRDPAAARFAFVIREVAARVAPGDPLARGASPRGPGSRRSGRGAGIIPFLIIFFVLMALRGRRSGLLGPLIIASALSRHDRGGWGGGGWGGGGGGGFGGFSGGGGMSGGGGASGGW